MNRNSDVSDLETQGEFQQPQTISAAHASKSLSCTFWLIEIKDSFEALSSMK